MKLLKPLYALKRNTAIIWLALVMGVGSGVMHYFTGDGSYIFSGVFIAGAVAVWIVCLFGKGNT